MVQIPPEVLVLGGIRPQIVFAIAMRVSCLERAFSAQAD